MTADQPLEHLLAEVATGLWRLQRRLDSQAPESSGPESSAPENSAPGSSSRETRAAARQVRRIIEILGDADIRIDDHHGVTFDPGLAFDVVAYQPTEGLDRELVIDTERPSIFRGAATLQRGRVIVGVPMKTLPVKASEETA